MSNSTIRIAIGLRVGAPICQPHTCCHCGKDVDQFSHHGLCCRASQGRSSRPNALNDIINRSLAAVKIPSRLEPSVLLRSDGNRPDGVTMIPWSEGKFLVWNFTCVDTLCESHKQRSGKPKSFAYLLQRLSVAIQVGNSTSVLGTHDNSWD